MSVMISTKSTEAFVGEGGESGYGNRKKDVANDTREGEEGRMKAAVMLPNGSIDCRIRKPIKRFACPSIRTSCQSPAGLTRALFWRIHSSIRTLCRPVSHWQKNPVVSMAFGSALHGEGASSTTMDSCHSGFTVATWISDVPLPWRNPDAMVLAPPDLSKLKTSASGIATAITFVHKTLTRDIPVAVCERLIFFFLRKAEWNP